MRLSSVSWNTVGYHRAPWEGHGRLCQAGRPLSSGPLWNTRCMYPSYPGNGGKPMDSPRFAATVMSCMESYQPQTGRRGDGAPADGSCPGQLGCHTADTKLPHFLCRLSLHRALHVGVTPAAPSPYWQNSPACFIVCSSIARHVMPSARCCARVTLRPVRRGGPRPFKMAVIPTAKICLPSRRSGDPARAVLVFPLPAFCPTSFRS